MRQINRFRRQRWALASTAAAAFLATTAHADPRSTINVAPCVTAACTQWVPLGDRAERSKVFATYSLGRPNPHIRRALIMVHGALRNGDHYFATATSAGFLAGALRDTIIIAPDFASAQGDCHDKLATGEVNWGCEGDSWKSGGPAIGEPGVTSFDFMDTLLKRLADRRLFPNLKVIVVAGHSAGGQFVTRYEMANQIHERLGVPVQYAVANPSSYAWPDALRPLPMADASPDAAREAWQSEEPHTDFQYGPFDSAKAPDFDTWPKGLEGRKSGYASRLTNEALRRQLAGRPTTYLLGQVDVLPLGGFDDSPSAMAQGPTRRARGEAFVKHIEATLGARPRLMIVPECGHNDRCIFTTDAVLPVLFPAVETRAPDVAAAGRDRRKAFP